MQVTVDIDLPTPPPFYAWSTSGAKDLDHVCLWYDGDAKAVKVAELRLTDGAYYAKAVDLLAEVCK
jgi:hypothetical protein